MDNKLVARELAAIARDLVAMDFPTQGAMDKYLREHPDADKSKHRVVKHDPSKPETHPMNLMQQRKNEEKMEEIGKALKKKPEDLTNADIIKYNESRSAHELLAVARDLLALEFPTQDAYDKYMKEHPDADKSLHSVKKTEKKPAKKEEALPEREDVENAFRDHLSGTGRTVTKDSMKSVIKGQFKGITDTGFNNVWNNLVEEKYLIPQSGGRYKWEM